jgi:transcription elongation factor Elf1
MTEETKVSEEEFGNDDIFFECPRCGKSMGIAKAGIGMVVSCTECEMPITVPVPENNTEDDTEIALEEINKKRETTHFDANFTLKREKLDFLFDEITAIQHALDRIMSTLEIVSTSENND